MPPKRKAAKAKKPPRRKVKRKRKCVQTEYLQGPIEIDILERRLDGARIVLLGDRHVHQTKCPRNAQCKMTIVNYLDHLFATYNRRDPLDFFLEMDFPEADRAAIDSILKDPKELAKRREKMRHGSVIQNFAVSLQMYFYNCLQKTKSQCEFANKPQIRFHYSDVRGGVLHTQTKSEHANVIKEFQALVKLEHPKDLKLQHIDTLGKYIQEFLADDVEKAVDFFFALSKIDKQLKRIHPRIVAQLREYMKEHMRTKRPEAKLFLAEYQTLRNELLNKHRYLARAKKLHLYVSAFLMTPLLDIYTLARIVRHDMKQVIVYAGWVHTRSIKSFLPKLDFHPVLSKESKKQCVNLGGVPQPWFQ